MMCMVDPSAGISCLQEGGGLQEVRLLVPGGEHSKVRCPRGGQALKKHLQWWGGSNPFLQPFKKESLKKKKCRPRIWIRKAWVEMLALSIEWLDYLGQVVWHFPYL